MNKSLKSVLARRMEIGPTAVLRLPRNRAVTSMRTTSSVISVPKNSLTAQLVLESNIFIVNFIGIGFAETVRLLGKTSGYTVDKFTTFSVLKMEADGVDCCRLKDAVSYIGCHVVAQHSFGDFVLIIGRIAEFKGERYIRPEIVRLISLDWALLRRLELMKEYGVPNKEEKVVLVPEKSSTPEVEPSLAAREKILTIIEKMEEVAEQILVDECKMSKDKVMVALYDLLKEGEIFSPKKGFYRLV